MTEFNSKTGEREIAMAQWGGPGGRDSHSHLNSSAGCEAAGVETDCCGLRLLVSGCGLRLLVAGCEVQPGDCGGGTGAGRATCKKGACGHPLNGAYVGV